MYSFSHTPTNSTKYINLQGDSLGCALQFLRRACVCVCGPLQVTWNTSPSWSPGACWRCWSTSTSGRGRRPSASPTSCFPCWSWCPRREPRPPSACATPGSPSSGDLQPLHLLPLPSLLSPLSPETATDHFPVWAYQIYIYFSIFLFFVLSYFFVFIVELMLLCTFCFVRGGSSLSATTLGIQ